MGRGGTACSHKEECLGIRLSNEGRHVGDNRCTDVGARTGPGGDNI